MADKTTELDRDYKSTMNRNPEGKGGFQERPQDISPGGWSKETSQSYWLHKFQSLTVDELEKWKTDNPMGSRLVAADLALTRILECKKDFRVYQAVVNRCEGMPRQTTEVNMGTAVTGVVVLPELNPT